MLNNFSIYESLKVPYALCLLISVILFSDTFAEFFCDKVSLTMLRSDSLLSVELFSAVIVPIEVIRSHHTLRKLPC